MAEIKMSITSRFFFWDKDPWRSYYAQLTR